MVRHESEIGSDQDTIHTIWKLVELHGAWSLGIGCEMSGDDWELWRAESVVDASGMLPR
jgi:hypothetical protein